MAPARAASEKLQAWNEFARCAVESRGVWAVMNEKGLLGAEGLDGTAAQPFWSTRGAADRMLQLIPAAPEARIVRIALEEFVSRTLLTLAKANVRIGLDWATDRQGWVFDAAALRGELRRLIHLRLN